jgi:membrane dipeptidase
MIPVFDGHNDFLMWVAKTPAKRDEMWLQGAPERHLDLPRMHASGFAGGFFAIYIPSPESSAPIDYQALMSSPPYAIALPEPLRLEQAQPVALAMAGHLMGLERTGTLQICRSVSDIREAMASGRIAAVMHMEGAEAIGADLDALHLFHALGLRSIGPVWSRPTVFGHGVPLAFPGTPDTGPGLTAAGKALVRECNALRIMIDLSHLNEAGFDDVAALSNAPLVATHSNAHAITPSPRNLTDRQLAMIAQSRGMVGLNFATVFLSRDGHQARFSGWEPVLAHLDHLIAKLGEDHVGLGSDFDGCTLPADLGDVTGLPRLLKALENHGYSADLIEKLAFKNWLALLERTWQA